MVVEYRDEYDAAMSLASQGWSQPDIRQYIMSHFGGSWLHADVVAGDAVDRDNATRAQSMVGRAA